MHAATTETATLFLAARVWTGGEIVFDPEISGGKGFSGTTGLAGFSNGEATRVGVPEPTPYIARLFLRQTWGLDGPWEKIEDAPNQVAGRRDQDNVTLTVGKFSATDIFDLNRYSHDPRTQFLNWSIMYNGAWDYPANVRGYTYGVALEFNTVFWAVRYGIFAEPAVANGAPLDPHILKANGQILEFQQNWGQDYLPGKLREWVFLNHAHMGNYGQALAEMPVDPDITLTRTYRFKYGYGMNLEQALTTDLRLFVKAGWNDGHSESWAFTAIDRTAAVGLLLNGRPWRRPDDEIGFAGVINGLDGAHHHYLAAGGLDFIIGDGRLNYAPEEILEAYYNFAVVKGINVSLDLQGVNHPAYNADRGPVAIGTIRVHFEH
jgi:high affinity Mn2+ porin